MVTKGNGKVSPFAIIGDVGIDGDRVFGFVSKIVEKFSHALLAIGILSEGVDNPDLAGVDGTMVLFSSCFVEACTFGGFNSRSKRGTLLVAGDKLNILNTAALPKVSLYS